MQKQHFAAAKFGYGYGKNDIQFKVMFYCLTLLDLWYTIGFVVQLPLPAALTFNYHCVVSMQSFG